MVAKLLRKDYWGPMGPLPPSPVNRGLIQSKVFVNSEVSIDFYRALYI